MAKIFLHIFISICVFFHCVNLFAQQKNAGMRISYPEENRKEGETLIYLEHSDILLFDKDRLEDIQVLKGNVCFRHDDALMYCDSAYFYEKENSLDAFSNVRIIQGDTLFIYGDVLYYDGNTSLARLRNNVRMENRSSVLTTDSLNYDRRFDVGYYFNGGKLTDQLNELVSEWGYYYPSTNIATFRYKVVMTNPNFVMTSDTLHYNTKTEIADIVGPTDIIYDQETHIYSEKGWYDTRREYSELLDNSYIEHQDTKRLTGDSILYDKPSGFAWAFQNVELADTLKDVSLFGHYGYYNEITKIGLATDSAMMIEYSSADTLYLHADTLFLSPDSTFNVIEAYHNVRFFRNDVQGVADSMAYTSRDSVLHMLYDPIVWSDKQQITGDTIRAYSYGEGVSLVHVINSAFACQMCDSVHFNQISGKEMFAHISDDTLRLVEVKGNTESIYYPIDEADGEYIGQNKTQSSYLTAYFKNGDLDRMILFPSPTGNLFPMDKIKEEMLYFPGFSWQVQYRPNKKEDIFLSFDRNINKGEEKKTRRRSSNKKQKE